MLNATSDLTRRDNVYFKDSLNSTFVRKLDREID